MSTIESDGGTYGKDPCASLNYWNDFDEEYNICTFTDPGLIHLALDADRDRERWRSSTTSFGVFSVRFSLDVVALVSPEPPLVSSSNFGWAWLQARPSGQNPAM